MSMKEYIQEKNHTDAHSVTKGLSEKSTWMSMKEYVKEKNHTDTHNVTKGFERKKQLKQEEKVHLHSALFIDMIEKFTK